jgi:two-component system, chemotaxis family, chemotaxis protein CheY
LSTPQPPASTACVNILVVDDDIDLCTLLSRFLEKHGYEVYSAQDALQAVDILQREQIGIVLTDFNMPHVDGIRFTEQLRKDPRYAETPVIMMSGELSDDISDRGMRKGVAMTLAKPIDFERLLSLVKFAE